MTVRNDTLAATGSYDRYVGRLGQLENGCLCVRSRHAASGKDERGPGLSDDLGGRPEVFGIGQSSGDTGGSPQLDFLSLHSCLGGHLDQCGTWAAGAHLPERFEYGMRHFAGSGSPPLPLGHRANSVGLVGDFVNGSEIPAYGAARDLARGEENGRGARVGIGQAGRGVVETNSRDHRRHSWLAGRAGIAVGHLGCGLFVARGDHANARLVP